MVDLCLRSLSIIVKQKRYSRVKEERDLSHGVEKLNQRLRERVFETESMDILERLC